MEVVKGGCEDQRVKDRNVGLLWQVLGEGNGRMGSGSPASSR